MRGRVNEASNDNLAREESGETRRTDTEGGGSLFRLLRDFALASLPARFQPEWCKDGKMEEDGERERCANVVGARKEAENTPLSPRYFSLNGTRAAEMDVPCPCVFLPSPPPLSSRPKLLPVESRRGERGCDEVEGGKRNACNEEEGRKESFGSGACGCGARGGKNVERRKTDGGGRGGWLVERA